MAKQPNQHTHKKRTAVMVGLGIAAIVGVGAAYAAMNKEEGDSVIRKAQEVVESRANQAEAEMDAGYHESMADHYQQQVSATDSIGGKITNQAKAVTEKTKEGVSSVKAEYHEAKGDQAEKELVETISATVQ